MCVRGVFFLCEKYCVCLIDCVALRMLACEQTNLNFLLRAGCFVRVWICVSVFMCVA
jgi:hypothetical protein